MTATIIHGDCLDVLRGMADASVDAVVTDPPYELAFMGRKWDASGIAYNVDLWREVLRVLKPGGHLLAFGGTRTYHRMTCAIEDAGAEIRDCITWHYGQGFPKSHNIGGGLGTALKPSTEPIVVARKPLVGTVAANVAQHGTGAINVDGCRVETSDDRSRPPCASSGRSGGIMGRIVPRGASESHPAGRWPPNLLLTHSADCGDACADDCPVAMMDRQSGESPSKPRRVGRMGGSRDGLGMGRGGDAIGVWPADSGGGASRFFPTFEHDAVPFLYQAKAPAKERFAALICDCEALHSDAWSSKTSACAKCGGPLRREQHPTQKPVALMRWLVRLVTPPDGTILDPFAGSGTTLVAALAEGRQAIGIEREAEYVEIVKARLANAEAA